MATTNPITGDTIATRQITDSYRNNFDLIFRKKKDEPTTTADDPVRSTETTDTNEYTQAPD